eukprot:CAMPEP_0195530812 /NCGR_PEP_ID=MMETSP0794_2-20130614/33863_1 /TAXON_ID=515487 /ORGANISM="Stephanopyxis turris, Strain CCMP 815" /LENGTH=668 /DNA_ID=CAMNT_0040662397 /DNA_START=72 /DNA_END=2078 /DNA_ORIENTATION=-
MTSIQKKSRVKKACYYVALLALTTTTPQNGNFSLLPVAHAKKSSSRGVSAPSSRGDRGGGRSRKPAPTSRRRVYDDEEEDDDDFYDEDEDEEEVSEEDDMFGSMFDDDEEEESEEALKPMKRGGKQKASPRSRKGRGPPPPPTKKSRGYDDEDYDYMDEEEDISRLPAAAVEEAAEEDPLHPHPEKVVEEALHPNPHVEEDHPDDTTVEEEDVVVDPAHPEEWSPYGVTKTAGTFTRGLTAIRESLPDPTTIKESTFGAMNAARSATAKVSKGVYREIKGLTSSELEQVMLKATKPDDSPVKGKHVERLVGVTYQISARYDIYDSVLRKLWKKMIEDDWRTKIKSLYVLHRFSADGAPDHGPALKARLRELRRTRDPKGKDKFFNSKLLLAGQSTPENVKFRAFTARYAHYVLLRAQCFSGIFTEITPDSPPPPQPTKNNRNRDPSKPTPPQPQKPITSTALRAEHLEAAKMLLKAGCACTLKEGEECENTAIAVERVAADMMGLTAAVATALNRVIKSKKESGRADAKLVNKWCAFYGEELLPMTKTMVKRTSSKLDAYGLFLPSRMGASVSQEVLQKGLMLGEVKEEEKEENAVVAEGEQDATKIVEAAQEEIKKKDETKPAVEKEEEIDEYDAEEEEEGEYEEEEEEEKPNDDEYEDYEEYYDEE